VKKQYLLILEEVTQLRMELRHLKGRSDRIDKMFGKLERLLGEDEPLESHSEPNVVSEGESGTHQITTFTDLDPGYGVIIEGSKDETFDTVHAEDSGLASFLMRPTRILEVNWGTGTAGAINNSFNPWKLFFENETIADKIRYYNNLSCKLHVKFVVNGNSFLYGRVLVSYEPLHTFNQMPLANITFTDYIPRSQRPLIMLNPTTNEGGTMELPYMFPNNYMNIPKADWDDMGEITMSDLVPLQHATGAAGEASVTVYAWASDIVLTTPTALESQSKNTSAGKKKKTMSTSKSSKSDEYGKGIISKPASAIAAGAGWLSNLPTIGPYARATQMVATGIGQAASLFGYSRPPVLEGPCTTKLISSSPFANTDRQDTVMKLSLDSKQELTIDPRVAGAPGDDHMGIYELVQKESLLTQFDWNLPIPGGNVVGDQLFAANVTPSLCTTEDSGNTVYMTPMAWMSQLFRYWHGPVKFRFQVVASNFHKGRLLITYDPNQFTSATENRVYSEVVDISETTDFEVEIGWGISLPWRTVGRTGRPVGSLFEEFVNDDTVLPYSETNANGQLVVTVLNDLTSPGDNATAPGITVNVWVSGGDSMKFGVPTSDRIQDMSVFPLESQSLFVSHSASGVDAKTDKSSMENKPGETMSLSVNSESNNDHMMEVFFGEHIVSLRDLFRRYVYSTPWQIPGVTSDNNNIFLFTKVFPFYRGTMAQGVPGIYDYLGVDAENYSVNPSVTIPLTYCAPAYMAWRGGIRKKLVNNTGDTVGTMLVGVTRKHFQTVPPGWRVENYNDTIDVVRRCNYARESFAGQELSMVRNTGMVEVEFPYYQRMRFSSPRITHPREIQSDSYEYVVMDAYGGDTLNKRNFLHEYVSTAEDFSLIYFINVPVMYRYDFVAQA
jgi:hypothetical protein